jgi:hypothetical protein
MGLANSKNESLNKELIKELMQEILNDKESYMTQKLNSQNSPEKNGNTDHIKRSSSRLDDFLEGHLNLCFGYDEYKKLNLKPGQLKATVMRGLTVTFPDQIPRDVLINYIKSRSENMQEACNARAFFDRLAKDKPKKIKDIDFQTLLTQSIYSKSIYSFNELAYGCEKYAKLFGIDSVDYLLDEYFLMDLTVIRAVQIKTSDNLWIAPEVVLFKRRSNDTLNIGSLDVIAIAVENLNNVDCCIQKLLYD